MKFSGRAAAALALGAWLSAGGAGATMMSPAVDVVSFQLNPALIINMYNVAVQNNNVITSYPANMDPAVLVATLRNTSATEGVQPCFKIEIKEGDKVIVSLTSGYVRLKTPLNPGETRVADANAFEVPAGVTFNGAIDTDFRNEFESDFKSVDPSKLQAAVSKILSRTFKVCLIPIDCVGLSQNGAIACDNFKLFTGNTSADCSVAILIYPHNNAVPSNLPTFAWAPAWKNNCPQEKLGYLLEVMREDAGSQPIARIRIEAGQTVYQWRATDPALEANVKYFWRVVGLDCNGTPFCGADGKGWNIVKWFLWQDASQAACRYTLEDINRFVRRAAKPEIQEELKQWLVKALNRPGSFNDPFVCRLLEGKIPVSSIEFKK